eukprot:m.10488 g.10488  ORF g.10488 m.10488 type:complete len:457 (-) comp7521_c0_seq1:341-1711(-)
MNRFDSAAEFGSALSAHCHTIPDVIGSFRKHAHTSVLGTSKSIKPFPRLWTSILALLWIQAVNAVCLRQSNTEKVYLSVGNIFAIITIVLGVLSITLCLCVIAVILAYNKDRKFLRERLILGLMCTNVMYSGANCSPMNLAITRECQYVLTQVQVAWARGFWLFGKYWMACYEIFIVGISLHALRTGKVNIPPRTEIAAHILCGAAGAIALVTFLIMQLPLASSADHSLDEFYIASARQNFSEVAQVGSLLTEELDSIQRNVSLMLRIWFVPFSMTLILWLLSRYVYHLLCVEWKMDFQRATETWNRDLWAEDDQQIRERREKILNLRRDAFAELATPLEPYVAIFVVFAIPAIIMSTDYCVQRSKIPFFCTSPNEMVLAMRSLAVATVYFLNNDNFQQLRHGGQLCTKLRTRFSSAGAWIGRHLQGRRAPVQSNREGRVSFHSEVNVRLLPVDDD